MMKPIQVALGVSLLVLPSAGFAASGASMADMAFVRALKAGDGASATKCFTDTAIVWVDGAPAASGSAQIQKFWTTVFDAATVQDISLREIGNESVGATSVSWGTYSITFLPKKAGSAPTTGTGRYTEIAKKMGGKWVYTVEHASADPAPKKV